MGTETIFKYKDKLQALALYLGCDWTVLAGQLMQESSGDPSAIGDNGLAYGLSQIHRATLDNHHPDWAMESMLDEEKHMEVYEAEMKRIFDWLKKIGLEAEAWMVVACWNWGVGNFKKWAAKKGNIVYKHMLPGNINFYVRQCYKRAELFQE